VCSEAIDHDLDTDESVLLVLRLHQFDHEFHNGVLPDLEWFIVGKAMEEGQESMAVSLSLDQRTQCDKLVATYVIKRFSPKGYRLLVA
jgi:hypothetical protein